MRRRRQLLTLAPLAVVSTAGCVSPSAPEDSVVAIDSLSIQNEDDSPHELSIEITEADEVVFQDTLTLGSKSGDTVENPVDGTGDYTVTGTAAGDAVRERAAVYAEVDEECTIPVFRISTGEELFLEIRTYTSC